ncbi:MAG TPA: MFS transporter, partial [Bacteroidetes bacterium]|nr:MFS transporter [Bacteroidota bacterium]
PLTCGMIGETEGWHYGFALAGIGMLVGLGVFYWGLKSGVFEDKGLEPAAQKENLSANSRKDGVSVAKPPLFSRDSILVYLGTMAAIPLVYLLLHHSDILDYILLGISGGMILYLFAFALQQEKIQREQIFVIIVLFFFTALFWTFFELAGSAISVFTKSNVDRHLFGSEIATSAFQSVNPLFIIFLAPVFTWLWAVLAKKNSEPSAPLKFAIGVLLLGLGFIVLGMSDGFATAGMVPIIFLILGYLLHTLGELCLSPVGLSLVTKLSPAQLVGFVMGIWFLSSSVAHNIGKYIATETASDGLSAVDKLPIFTGVFYNVGLFALGASVLLFALSPILKKWMHGIK